MKRSSVTARGWAILMAAALVFAQVTLAAYACPAGAPHKVASMSAMSAMSAMGDEGCDEVDPASRHLCAKSCQDEPQHETPSVDALPPSLDAGLPVAAPQPRVIVTQAREFSLAHATSPPASILYSRFLK